MDLHGSCWKPPKFVLTNIFATDFLYLKIKVYLLEDPKSYVSRFGGLSLVSAPHNSFFFFN